MLPPGSRPMPPSRPRGLRGPFRISVPSQGEGARIWVSALRRAEKLGISMSTLVLLALREQEHRGEPHEAQLRLPL